MAPAMGYRAGFQVNNNDRTAKVVWLRQVTPVNAVYLVGGRVNYLRSRDKNREFSVVRMWLLFMKRRMTIVGIK